MSNKIIIKESTLEAISSFLAQHVSTHNKITRIFEKARFSYICPKDQGYNMKERIYNTFAFEII
ncbi:hypothetical protein [Anaerosphaera multitolerans]|uniref:Uncharacterized protein n=1 Tax=Anaerosphaera multitolerans TaxID=2487351 RepID=A0A437S740_9FIRM|nr:hypothetical protein [Anaerosphaera multitolerans]RVU54859.1 hypothetical protein EF514_04540 [Anaerosphaera multitolerans]